MSHLRFFLVPFLIFLSTHPLYCQPTVHALIAVDSSSDLKSSVLKDQTSMLTILQSLENRGATVSSTVLSGEELTQQNVNNWIDNIPQQENLTVLFYFSGHGVRTSTMTTPWPFLVYQQGEEYQSSNALRKMLLAKKSRLLIMLTDCCNSRAMQKSVEPFHYGELLSCPLFQKSAWDLFIRPKGSVCITAAKPGHSALGYSHAGGLMTHLLLSSMTARGATKNSWKRVIKYLEKHGARSDQLPHSHIHIKNYHKPPAVATTDPLQSTMAR